MATKKQHTENRLYRAAHPYRDQPIDYTQALRDFQTDLIEDIYGEDETATPCHYVIKTDKVTHAYPIFLTRKHAQNHLDRYGYNYRNQPHTYANAIYRSPELETLIALILNIDLDKSILVFTDNFKKPW
ncbi:MAG: hypothetical protein PUK59_04640 [Actinomycetaceae bacterium]|nr:hypothetical protein [Actinomycetaceae bacterium]MDY5273638.1 hypothetical protein [Arcanobacterium sp.]